MPTYSYACQECGHRFETSQRITEAPLSDCPECKKTALKKVLSATGIVFKGSGWSRGSSKVSKQDDLPPMPNCGSGGCGGGTCSLG
ncbi:Zinc ribbon domain-containing protein [Gammaproteobacteria bacterium]